MRVVFAGTPDVAIPSLEALAASQHDVVGVVTRPDARSGRGKRLKPSPVAQWALDHGLPVLRPGHPRDAGFQAELTELAPDCCPVVAYGALLPETALTIPEHGWVNLHFSLLPRWRGAAPVQYAIWRGDQETGATTFRIVKELDAGPIYLQRRTPIGEDESSGELLTRLATDSADLLVETMDLVAAGKQPTPQGDSDHTLAGKITPENAHLDWAEPARRLARQIRACDPAPGAWTTVRGERLKVLGAVADPSGEERLKPGELSVGKRSVRVGTAQGSLELTRVQPAGKKLMAAADWARGTDLTDVWLGV
ncbi:methionyl-tRNA formyltransferase [Parenemella sanctibonifatiensis]|uniref:Methionyl-tRNA formyltransferase n=1 Tax=Parenemella sanctibonifatiensis TaxID=2016505 RepID=A0A255EIT0_9ACTN|nr:methionyl-tRNA formyltransferase [Parenemella sanctibonifatiensis]OYN91438.1 methionyl-tRNA formyltransferase [Parenemella sanctibonifatiensis]